MEDSSFGVIDPRSARAASPMCVPTEHGFWSDEEWRRMGPARTVSDPWITPLIEAIPTFSHRVVSRDLAELRGRLERKECLMISKP